jgi:formylglycine-generating enzyme required for sulfatase activity
VVGVSQFQATAYCDWLESKLNESLKSVIPKGYKIVVDLPTSAEFYAAVDACILKPTIKSKRNDLQKYFQKEIDFMYKNAD